MTNSSSQAYKKTNGNVLRAFPYPFSHAVSFSGDVDGQAPWHGVAIHRVINEELGLTLTGSVWVQSGLVLRKSPFRIFKKLLRKVARRGGVFQRFLFNFPSSFFVSGRKINNEPSGVDGHTTLQILLRQWHRGNIDCLHSWQQDYVYQIVDKVELKYDAEGKALSFSLQPPPEPTKGSRYFHLRLIFENSPPSLTTLTLVDNKGRRICYNSEECSRLNSFTRAKERESALELILNELSKDNFDLCQLTHISCRSDDNFKLIRLERDNFSRATVEDQLPLLEMYNIRPYILTCHGGLTHAQNLSPPGYIYRPDGFIKEDGKVPYLRRTLESLADQKGSHAYHADLLRKLGIEQVWGYGGSAISWNEDLPEPEVWGEKFYNLRRTDFFNFDTESADIFSKNVLERERSLKDIDVRSFYCPEPNKYDQGVMLGLLAYVSICQAKVRQGINHLWYTHYATGDATWKRSSEKPLKETAIRGLKDLANHFYNFDGTVAQDHRIWVPPAGVLARYRSILPQIEQHLEVDAESSCVTIVSWCDKVTGKRVPNTVAGTRDLHGITIYVPDAEKASLFIDDQETPYFSRNPADGTGRQSITIVDSNTPTLLMSGLPLDITGAVSTRSADFKAQDGNELSVTKPGEASLHYVPLNVCLWNVQYFFLKYRKLDTNVGARVFVELIMKGGGRIVFQEGVGNTPPRGAPSGDWMPVASSENGFVSRLFSTATLLWKDVDPLDAGSSLFTGQVDHILIGLVGAEPGDRLEIATFRGLRPASNGEQENGQKVVGGRVVSRSGHPIEGKTVTLILEDTSSISTNTDRYGYYAFSGIARRERVRIFIEEYGKRFFPVSGEWHEIVSNQMELDFVVGKI